MLVNEIAESEIDNTDNAHRFIEIELPEPEVTYTEGADVYHRTNCRAQQRIKTPIRTTQKHAIEILV